jgi:orotate phosphoribosyltransferase
MQNFKKDLLKLVIKKEILRFGNFTLKSGRKSSYFFNAGLFNTGDDLSVLSRCYAESIQNSKLEFDVLFGPAYKGIPLSSAISVVLSRDYDKNVGFCYNRKETKKHGEKGNMVGAPLVGNILIVDDVITAGTAITEAIDIIHSSKKASLAGIVVALDRMEHTTDGKETAIEHLSSKYKTKIISIINIMDIINYLPDTNKYKAILQNQQKLN